MKIKVCGITKPEQISLLQSHYAGMIFAHGSPRFVPISEAHLFTENGPERIGVFVNASLEFILEHIKAFKLCAVQLHGNESPELASELRSSAIVIKAIGMNDKGFVLSPQDYEEAVDFYLFDTHGKDGGGTGKKFNWNILQNITKPFFLAGGIGPEDALTIRALNLPNLYAVDINSRFEVSPGIKDLEAVNKFIKEVSA